MSNDTIAQSGTLLVDDAPAEDRGLSTVPAPSEGLALAIERLAANPQVDVAKLEKVIELQERILRHNAKAAFDAAFARMAPEIPEISEKGKVLVRGTLRSTYAPLEDIHEVIKPIMKPFGFAVRHRTEWPADKPGIIRIVGILSHEQGHSEESVFEAPMDQSDYRTDIQSMGSTVTYGRRYTTLDLLNIATRGADDDARTAGREAPPAPPDGYEEWVKKIEAAAAKGLKAFDPAWECSEHTHKNYAHDHHRQWIKDVKLKAAKAGKA